MSSVNSHVSRPSPLNVVGELSKLHSDALSYVNDLHRHVHFLERMLNESDDTNCIRASECRDHLYHLDNLNDHFDDLSLKMISVRTELLQALSVISRKEAELRCILAEHERDMDFLCSRFNRDVELLKHEIQVWFRHYLDAKHPVSLTVPSPNDRVIPFSNTFEVPLSDPFGGAEPSHS
uniref:Uncharacterized protein n=1 Tax=Cannabis sativa TaxID=3483 RepID=A0A803P2B1_CANSA